jgi:hypothetical protein
MSLLPASGEFLFGFPSPRHLPSSGSYPLDLSGLGDPTGSNATAGLALRVTGTHKPLYHSKVKIPTKGNIWFRVSKKGVLNFLLSCFIMLNPKLGSKMLREENQFFSLIGFFSTACLRNPNICHQMLKDT